MEETTVTIIGVVIAIVIMFIFPLILLSERSDDISELFIQTATAEFVDEIIKTGKITDQKYKRYVDRIVGTGNTYDIDIELKILDENTAKVLTESNQTELGNNTYFSIFTSQIEEMIGRSETSNTQSNTGEIVLKQGDIILVTVKNSSKTMSQTLKSFFSGQTQNGIKIITATASGTVAIDGKT